MKNITFKNISLQNFFSYGNEQFIDFEQFSQPVVLIDGIDLDTEGSRIGAGKSSILNGIIYALFGETINKSLKSDQVINIIKGKECVVTLNLEINKVPYTITRGRKPNKVLVVQGDNDMTRADLKDNDHLIEHLLGINSETFLQTVLFSTLDSKPFLELKAGEQKTIFEYIFGFELVNSTIDTLKIEFREMSAQLSEKESVIKEIETTNSQIEGQIERLVRNSEEFEQTKITKMNELSKKIKKYDEINLSEEKELHELFDDASEHLTSLQQSVKDIKLDIATRSTIIKNEQSKLEKLIKQYEESDSHYCELKDNTCPTCKREWVNPEAVQTFGTKLEAIEREIADTDNHIHSLENTNKTKSQEITEIQSEIEELKLALDQDFKFTLDEKEVSNFNFIKQSLVKELEQIKNSENYFVNEIEENMKLIREIDLTDISDLKFRMDAMKLLVKYAEDTTMRGKFFRRFIKNINRILSEFKKQLSDYNIHIQFNKDFTINIMKLGKKIPAGSLSNGERRIGNIMIMLALMKLFKSKNSIQFNFMFLDEVLDSGVDEVILEKVYNFIIEFSKSENLRIFLISHREYIKSQIEEKIFVTKQRGISTIEILTNN